MIVYTDGSVTKAGVGGWAYVIPELSVEMSGMVEEATNNTMELQAVIEVLLAYPAEDITIISDSQYVVLGASSWVEGWRRNNWMTLEGKPVKNPEHWQALVRAERGDGQRTVLYKWVKGHAFNEGNERADELAQAAARGKDGDSWATHRHVKTGGLYKVLRQNRVRIEKTGEPAVVYQGEDGMWWVRPRKEFFDGRFEALRPEEETVTE